jgi:dTDP-4-amino-4,6-dideoxygalactose transaminase
VKIPLSKIEIDDEIREAVVSVLDSGKFILGNRTEEFEEKFAKFCNTKYAACVSSGTAALFLSLHSLGIKRGDEVIIPSLSFVATATPIMMHGAIPKFVEVNRRNFTIEPDSIKKQITEKTKGIIPVHLYGHPANIDPIMKIAKEHSLFVLEDSAQAHGAKYKNKMIGSLGDASCFSFYPSKNLTVCGDGGMITSNDDDFIHKVKILRDHGRTEKYLHKVLGYNLRFNEIQAAIGLVQLKRLNENNKARRKIAKIYSKRLDGVVDIPMEEKWALHVYHMYTIRMKKRDSLQKALQKVGISTGIHYPVPIHKQPLIPKSRRINLPITEEIARTTLSLPMYPSLKIEHAEFVARKIVEFLRKI